LLAVHFLYRAAVLRKNRKSLDHYAVSEDIGYVAASAPKEERGGIPSAPVFVSRA
jgi:hypothetical protein